MTGIIDTNINIYDSQLKPKNISNENMSIYPYDDLCDCIFCLQGANSRLP